MARSQPERANFEVVDGRVIGGVEVLLGFDAEVDDGVRFVGFGTVRIGPYSRVDTDVVLSVGPSGVDVGRNCHIGVGSVILASSRGFFMDDFAGISVGVKVFTSSDDYSGKALTNPTVPERFRQLDVGTVEIGKHGIVGANSVLLPGVRVGDYSAVGALSVIRRSIPPGLVVAGNPVRIVQRRDSRNLGLLEKELLGDDG